MKVCKTYYVTSAPVLLIGEDGRERLELQLEPVAEPAWRRFTAVVKNLNGEDLPPSDDYLLARCLSPGDRIEATVTPSHDDGGWPILRATRLRHHRLCPFC